MGCEPPDADGADSKADQPRLLYPLVAFLVPPVPHAENGIKRVKPQTPVLMKQLEDAGARPRPSVSQIGLLLFSLCSIPHRQYIFTHKPHQDFMDDPACEVSEIVCFYYLREDAIISKTILPFSSTQNCRSVNVYRPHVRA